MRSKQSTQPCHEELLFPIFQWAFNHFLSFKHPSLSPEHLISHPEPVFATLESNINTLHQSVSTSLMIFYKGSKTFYIWMNRRMEIPVRWVDSWVINGQTKRKEGGKRYKWERSRHQNTANDKIQKFFTKIFFGKQKMPGLAYRSTIQSFLFLSTGKTQLCDLYVRRAFVV